MATMTIACLVWAEKRAYQTAVSSFRHTGRFNKATEGGRAGLGRGEKPRGRHWRRRERDREGEGGRDRERGREREGEGAWNEKEMKSEGVFCGPMEQKSLPTVIPLLTIISDLWRTEDWARHYEAQHASGDQTLQHGAQRGTGGTACLHSPVYCLWTRDASLNVAFNWCKQGTCLTQIILGKKVVCHSWKNEWMDMNWWT